MELLAAAASKKRHGLKRYSKHIAGQHDERVTGDGKMAGWSLPQKNPRQSGRSGESP
jgi:hypothetical protein